MDRETVIALAVKAGITPWSKQEWSKVGFAHTDDGMDGDVVCLLQFAALVAAHEREECANTAMMGTGEPVQTRTLEIIKAERERIAVAIRSRT